MNVLTIVIAVLIFISSTVTPAKTSKEREELEKLYEKPVKVIANMMFDATKYCQRLPSNQEFHEFVLNGTHKDIECEKRIGASSEQNGKSRYVIGKLVPHLVEFLKNKQYEIISNTKHLFLILKHDPEKWEYKDIDRNNYSYVISCYLYLRECKFELLGMRNRKCQSEAFPREHCYFGDKKIINFREDKNNPPNISYRPRRLSDIYEKRERENFLLRMQETKTVHNGSWSHELYYLPISAISLMLEYSSKYCERFPSEDEFKQFVLNKAHKNIKCKKDFRSTEYKDLLKGILGIGNPTLSEFIERKHYQYYSDKKSLVLVSRPVFKTASFHKKRSEMYDTVLRCTHSVKYCGRTPLKNVISDCQKSKMNNPCYFGSKKIIDPSVVSNAISHGEFPNVPPAPKNSRRAEEQELKEFHLYPLKELKSILELVVKHCNRPPKEAEFKNLILDRDLGGLRCRSNEVAKIKDKIETKPHLKIFLEQNKYEVLSDPYVFHFILKNNPAKWKFKYFDPKFIDSMFSCEIENEKCWMGAIESLNEKCKKEKTPEYCYLDGKKIFGTEKDK